MKMKKNNLWSYFIILILISCVESFEIENIVFEGNLVVEATLTNEFKNHTIKLSRTIAIDSTGISPEKNALVSIIDELNTTYNFQENENGIYTSITQFSAESNKKYTLNIETNNGKKYTSTPEKLPLTSEIESIFIDVEENDLGEPEAIIKTNSNSSNIEGQYYRYEYDETFKVKAPVWRTKKINIISDTPPYQFEIISKPPEEGIGFCYGTKSSKNIILTETKTLSQDKVLEFPVRYILLENYLIGIRYSIFLKQYVLNKNTYDYYLLLNKFSDPDDIFSQTQVGNIPSNISSNLGEKVIGFFEVSTISKKRIFFNRSDITSVATYTNYNSVNECTNSLIQPEITNSRGDSPLLTRLKTHVYQGTPNAPVPPPPNMPYILISKVCGECTHIGPPLKPDFWID